MYNQNKSATFADRLKEALRLTGTKQIELSRLTKIDKGTINNYLWGKYEPKQGKLSKIADALSVSPVWLMGFDVPMEREKKTLDKIQLTEGEEMLLEIFRLIPEEQQRTFLEMGRVYANSLKKD